MKSTKKTFRPRSPRSHSRLKSSEAKTTNDPRNHTKPHEKSRSFVLFRVVSWIVLPTFSAACQGFALSAALCCSYSISSLQPSQSPAFAQAKPTQDYLVYVLSEAADKISLIRFGPNGARVDHDLVTGSYAGRHRRTTRDCDLQRQAVLLRFPGARPAVWIGLEIFNQRRSGSGPGNARLVSGDHGPLGGRQPALCGELQPAWRHGALNSFRSSYRADARSSPHSRRARCRMARA